MHIPTEEINDARKNLEGLDSLTTQAEHEKEKLELIDTLTNGVRARHFYSRFNYETLKTVQKFLENALEKKEAEHLEAAKQEEKRQDLIGAIQDLLADSGFSLEDLTSGSQVNRPASTKPKKKYKKRRHHFKYRCEIFGQVYYWHGAGRTPRAFQCYMAKFGKVKEDCLLPEDEWLTEYDSKAGKVIPEEYQAEAEQLLAQYKDRI